MSGERDKLPPLNGVVSNRQLYEGLMALDERWERRFERVPTRREMLAYVAAATGLGTIAGQVGAKVMPIDTAVQATLAALGIG